MGAPTIIEVDGNGRRLVMVGRAGDALPTGVYASSVVGWYDSPDPKVQSTERGQGSGAYPLEDQDVQYAARTVSVGLSVVGVDRSEVRAAQETALALDGCVATITVRDAERETWARGYCSVTFDAGLGRLGTKGTLTVVCQDPVRRSVSPSTGYMQPASGSGGGGLVFSGGSGSLTFPLSFGGDAQPSVNVCTVSNSGTWPSDVRIEVAGSMPQGFVISEAGGSGQLSYPLGVTWQPLVLDGASRTATIAGVDVTRSLTSRDFPRVPPGGSVTLVMSSTGTGTATVTCHDCYI